MPMFKFFDAVSKAVVTSFDSLNLNKGSIRIDPLELL